MQSKRIPHTDTREQILATGEQLILGKGFSALGLAELLATAGVPKGSFYHYFPSKEEFGVALLQRYFSAYAEKMQALVDRQDVGAAQRLLSYFAEWKSISTDSQCQKLCLAIKLAAEVSDLSEHMRHTLATGMRTITGYIEELLRQTRQQGQLAADTDVAALASNLYSSWIGASLQTKVCRNMSALEAAEQQTRALLGLAKTLQAI